MRESYDNLEIVSETGTIPNVPVLNIKEKILGKKFNVNLIYCSPKKSQELNKTYRDKDYPTNILTFPLSDTEGEIYICRSIARKGYKEFDMSYAKWCMVCYI
jgi:ssRNA-specific RNase YbeY (16S rRNA maturation enzyme)